jgi:hypothetical protein
MNRDLDANEFGRCRDLVQRLLGIHYRPAQLHLLGNRLQQRMQPLGIADYGAYLDLIQRHDQRAELQQFVDSITTNDTSCSAARSTGTRSPHGCAPPRPPARARSGSGARPRATAPKRARS